MQVISCHKTGGVRVLHIKKDNTKNTKMGFCGESCAKWILFIMSFVFWVCGAALFGFGLYLIIADDATNYFDIATVEIEGINAEASIILFIVLGCIMFIVGLLGCCGAWRESSCMLKTYIILVIILLIVQIVAGVLAAVYLSKIEGKLEDSMETVVEEKYGDSDHEGLTDAMDFIQFEFKCCGVTDPKEDWQKWQADQDRNKKDLAMFPQTCCVQDGGEWDDPKPKDPQKCQAGDDEFYYKEGCFDELKDWLDRNLAAVIGVAFGILLIQIIGVLMACCVLQGMKD